MSKKYKLKGARPTKTLNIGTTPEGVQFIELSEKTNKMRLYENGLQEFYTNGELTLKVTPPLKCREIKQT